MIEKEVDLKDIYEPKDREIPLAPTKATKQLAEKDNWVLWKQEGERKVPYQPTGRRAKTNKKGTLSKFQRVKRFYMKAEDRYDGIGFVFTSEDNLIGIDLDNCRNPDTGKIDEWARKIIKLLNSFTEISPSGTGVHVLIMGNLNRDSFVTSEIPEIWGDIKEGAKIEIYQSKRFFTMTGRYIKDVLEEINERGELLESLIEKFQAVSDKEDEQVEISEIEEFEAEKEFDLENFEWERLIKNAKNAKNGKKFEELWEGEIEGYQSHSEADQALCCHLAFWVRQDPELIDFLFRKSGLFRKKWKRKDYRERTIKKAIKKCDGNYNYLDRFFD